MITINQRNKIPVITLSKDTQAFALFSEGKKPIEVAIKLDLGADSVDRLYQQFWKLEGLYQLNMIYKECSFAEYPASKTESDLRSCAKSVQESNVASSVNLQGLDKYRVQSPLFNFTFPKDNVAGVPAEPTQGVSDGNWIFLKPLAPGKNEIHFSGASVDFTTTGTNNFADEARYHLTVNP